MQPFTKLRVPRNKNPRTSLSCRKDHIADAELVIGAEKRRLVFQDLAVYPNNYLPMSSSLSVQRRQTFQDLAETHQSMSSYLARLSIGVRMYA